MTLLQRIVLALASVGYVSYLPYRLVPFSKWKGGGLLGSLAGWAVLWALPAQGGLALTVSLGLMVLAVPICHCAEKWLSSHDDPRIVLDEVAGILVAGWGIPRVWLPMILAFIFFRFFDVLKGPWGRWASRAPGGWGVVADDLLAGLFANMAVRLFLAFI